MIEHLYRQSVVLFAADKLFSFQAVLPIMTPVLLICGMTTGVFTPTEGAIAACVWALILGFAWYRRLEENLKVNFKASAEEITAVMKHEFAVWQGTNAQRDDVTAVVFRL